MDSDMDKGPFQYEFYCRALNRGSVWAYDERPTDEQLKEDWAKWVATLLPAQYRELKPSDEHYVREFKDSPTQDPAEV